MKARFFGRGAAGFMRVLPTALIVALVLVLWAVLPHIGWLSSRYRFLDGFFISSPSKVFAAIKDLLSGSHARPSIWPYMKVTLVAVFWGLIVGTLLGMASGLVLATSPRLDRSFSPIISFLNATPRIAMIPIFVIAFGPSTTTSVITAIAVVFFIAFYNAHAGARSPAASMVENARLLGASKWQVMRQIRLPYVFVWTTAALPNAISFGLIAVVTAEILTGSKGMGQLIYSSLAQVDSTLTFALVIILGVVGVTLLMTTRFIIRRRLRWWDAQTSQVG